MEWAGILCLFIALFADIQLIIMGTLPFIMPRILWLTGTYTSTMAGILAAITAAVVSQLFKTAKETVNKELVYSYSLTCRFIAIYTAGVFYLIAVILAIADLILVCSHRGEFRALMLDYKTDGGTKALVDNVQFALQCCGAHIYKDWYDTDWGAYETNNRDQRKTKCKHSNTTRSPLCRKDAVPYSCCARAVTSACVHRNLLQLGTYTVNHDGCIKKLEAVAAGYLCFEMVLYGVSLGLVIAVFLLLRTRPETKAILKAPSKQYSKHSSKEVVSERRFTGFSNSNVSINSIQSTKSKPSGRTKTTSKTTTTTTGKT